MVRVFDADDCVCAGGARFGGDALEAMMAGGVEDVGKFLDFAAREGFESAHQAAGDADGIGDVSEDENWRAESRRPTGSRVPGRWRWW